MIWTAAKVRKSLNGRLIGKPVMREFVYKTILMLPEETIAFVCSHVWFISSPEDAWAFTFRGAEIKERSLIIFSDDLFAQVKNQIHYTILHELGHVLLKHRNSIGYQQTQAEITRQEKEADNFAKKILSQYSENF